MRILYVTVLLILLSSCSVKKKVHTVQQQTTVSVERRDTVVVNSETDDIEVFVQDTLKPIVVEINGVVKTFTNAKAVRIRKKVFEEVKITEEKVVSEQQVVEKKKDVDRNNYLWVVLIIAVIWLSSRLKLRRLIGL